MKPAPSRIVIEAASPTVDGGRYPAKRVLGDVVTIEADVLIDGHDVVAAVLLDRAPDAAAAALGAGEWRERPMRALGNDRFAAEVPLSKIGRHVFQVEAWPDRFATWARGVDRKRAAKNLPEAGRGSGGGGLPPPLDDLASEALEGAAILESLAEKALGADDREKLLAFARALRKLRDPRERALTALDPALAAIAARVPDREGAAQLERQIEILVEPERSRFASWYELFPRSQGRGPGKRGTFADVERRLPAIQEMGFDVVYLPPIHPIGTTHRKGRNNSLEAGPDDPGSPWAIGGAAGGHRDVEPALGTVADFERLVRAARALDMEIALDVAFQCSPDHPYVKQHPEWFKWRPDGTIQYAENPPKKYQDIVPFDFTGPGWESLRAELRDVVLLWIERGVTTFRVDNPHTKPIPFWAWLISEVRERHPEAVFLSEAFTRPKIMRALAKAGFSQSYTYFTWRNWKPEIEPYLEELTRSEMREYFRANFWPNTPDILPEILQRGGGSAFEMRAVLAATLSPLWGIYSGYELCENEAIPGTEEYRNSEKYELKWRDWETAGRANDIRPLISRLNRIRRERPALRLYDNLRFHRADHERVLFYSKTAGDDVVLVAVNLDPFGAHEAVLHVPIEEIGAREGEAYEAEDLLSGAKMMFSGRENEVRLEAGGAAIFGIQRFKTNESSFDYY